MNSLSSLMSDSLPQRSPETQQAIDTFVHMVDASYQPSENPDKQSQPISLQQYKKILIELTNSADLFSEQLLEALLVQMETDSHLKNHFPDTFNLYLAPIPFSSLGHTFSKDEIEKGYYLQLLAENANGDTYGFSSNATKVVKLLPPEIQACGFKIPNYSNPKDPNPTPEERTHIIELYKEAFNKLKAALS
jgi:hypothetical protein